MLLDATAGNRMMWKNKTPPNTIFLDIEKNLSIPPDIIADNRYCPFRDNIFDCIIYDPPHYVNAPPWHRDPSLTYKASRGNWGTFYGNFKSKEEMFSSIYKAQKEFLRISKRLCLKWSEVRVSLWNVLVFFKDWIEINRVKTNNYYWITFIH